MDDRYTIDTPENIEFAYDVAGIGSRFLAAMIDMLLIGIAEIIIILIVGLTSAAIGLRTADSLLAGLGGLLAFAILWCYYIVFELLWNGQSPGKRVIGLRVVREGGRPIAWPQRTMSNESSPRAAQQSTPVRTSGSSAKASRSTNAPVISLVPAARPGRQCSTVTRLRGRATRCASTFAASVSTTGTRSWRTAVPASARA
jgi:hypothetical protein